MRQIQRSTAAAHTSQQLLLALCML